MRHLLGAFLTLLAFQAAAFPIQTRHGEVALGPPGPTPYEHGLMLNGARIEGVAGRFQLIHAFDWGVRGEVLLLQHHSGGMNCCLSYQLVHLSPHGISATPTFAEHGHAPSGFETFSMGIRFRLERDTPASIDHWNVVYMGGIPTVYEVMEDDSGVVAAGADDVVLAHIGQTAFSVLEDPAERVRFGRLMGREEMDQLRASLKMGHQEMWQDAGFVLGWGFRPHHGDGRFGYIAIEVATGKPYAVYSRDGSLTVFGSQPDDLPGPLSDLVTQNEARAAGLRRDDPRSR